MAPPRTTTEDAPTPRQMRLLQYIAEFLAENGYPPTVREMALAMHVKSSNGIVCHLKALTRKGWLEFDAMRARGIRLLRPVPLKGRAEVSGNILRVGSQQWELTAEQLLTLKVGLSQTMKGRYGR